jgi:DHA1 family bicyclomycin/chloramphenicol resistance-like MFS transporter
MNKHHLQSLIIGLGFPLTQFALVLYTPAYNAIAQHFHVDNQAMLFSFTVTLIGYTLGTLFWGALSDHMGRRPSFIAGLLCYIALACMIPLAPNFTVYISLLSLYGFSAATFTSVGNAMLRDLYNQFQIKQVIAYVGIAMAATPMISPWLGAHLLHSFNWPAIYIFVALMSSLMLIGILTYIPHTTAHSLTANKSLIQAIKHHFTNRTFIAYILILGLVFGSITCTIETLPILYTHYLSVSTLAFGYISLIFMAPYPLGAILSSHLVKYLTTRSLLLIGTSIGLIGAIGLTLLLYHHTKSTLLISICLALVFLAFGLSLSMAKAGAMSSVHHHVGSASSLMKFVQSLGGATFTLLNVSLHQTNSLSNFALIIIGLLTTCQLILWSLHQTNHII